jgi:hypothetical protein
LRRKAASRAFLGLTSQSSQSDTFRPELTSKKSSTKNQFQIPPSEDKRNRMNSRLFKLCVVIAALAAFLCTPAFAAKNHSHIAVVSKHAFGPEGAPAANLYGIAAYFGAEPLNAPLCDTAGTCDNVDPWNYTYPGGTVTSPDLWPCFGDNTAQPDCTYVGSAPGQVYGSGADTATSLPQTIVLGAPSYTWFLSANTATSQPYGCDASTASDINHFCAQAINFYEDDSGDTADDLVWEMVVTQGTKTIYDSGTQDYGPNPYGGLLAADNVAPVIVFFEDVDFGLGGGTGALSDNGPCFQTYYYPSTVAGAPSGNYNGEINTFGALFGIAGKATCSAPTSGAATVTITTELLPATWNPVTKLADCNTATMGGPANGKSPYCYTVKYGKATHSVSQKFTIWLN